MVWSSRSCVAHATPLDECANVSHRPLPPLGLSGLLRPFLEVFIARRAEGHLTVVQDDLTRRALSAWPRRTEDRWRLKGFLVARTS